jgi:hypothetical protein
MKLTTFLELQSEIRKNRIDIVCQRRTNCTALSPLGRLPQEFHLTFFPQG